MTTTSSEEWGTNVRMPPMATTTSGQGWGTNVMPTTTGDDGTYSFAVFI
jgi:hypothetical protein